MTDEKKKKKNMRHGMTVPKSSDADSSTASEVGAFSCAARISPVPTDLVGRELGGKHCPAPPTAQRFVVCSGRAYEINVLSLIHI